MSLSHSPSIITNGITLYLDIGNKKTYPGSGTALTDLIRQKSGSLASGMTVSYAPSAGYGSIVFDGTKHATVTSDNYFSQNNSFSIVSWVYNTDFPAIYTYRGFFAKGLYNSTGVNFYFGNAAQVGEDALKRMYGTISTTANLANNVTINVPAGSYLMPKDTWLMHTQTFDYNGTNTVYSWYIGTTLIGSQSPSGSIVWDNTNMYLGNTYAGDYRMIGNMSNFIAYNRALTLAEITQIYNVLKIRYGQ